MREGNAREENSRREGRQRELSPQERRRLRRLREQQKKLRRRRRIRRMVTVAAILVLAVVVLPRTISWGCEKVAGLRQWLSSVAGQETDEAQQVGGQVSADSAKENEAPKLSYGAVEAEVLQTLRDRYRDQDEAADILAHPENYPDALLTLLAKRPETLEFVLNYEEKKDLETPVDLSHEVEIGVIPRLYQWDQRWGYRTYGDNIIALAGCGPTCLSMVALGLTGETQWDPVKVAQFSEAQGYVSEVGTAWDLMTVGAAELGLDSQELPLDEGRMVRELEAGHPIICSMRPGDFTDTGHFIVLIGYEDGAFVVNDPNSIDNSEKTWNYEEIRGQIRNLWAFSLK